MPPYSDMPDEEILSLINASCQLVSRHELDRVIELIVSEAAHIVRADSCALLLRDAASNELYFHAVSGPDRTGVRRVRFDAERGVAGQVLRTGQPMIVNDPQSDPTHYNGVDRQTGFVTESLLCVPIDVNGQIIGVLEGVNSTRENRFLERDLQLLGLFANFCGCAIRNADAFERQKMDCQAFRTAAEHQDVFIGDGPEMRKAWDLVRKVAQRDCTVLLTGESGVGKEVLAWSIHHAGPRKDRPFLCVNCAALDENLLNSELFGHEKGAFTGATERRKGKFEIASDGTLFFDEIGSCSPATQARLLRVLQEQVFERIGGTETIRTRSRLIAATNADLEAKVADGSFREDLYHRVNVVRIPIPPLRRRREEITPLIEHYVRHFAEETHAPPVEFSAAAARILREYDWPGNVRELRNFVERVMVLHSGGVVEADHLAEYLPQRTGLPPAGSSPAGASLPAEPARSVNTPNLWEEEKRLIAEALEAHGWNLSATARALGVARHHLKYRVRKFGLRRP
ncbi:MAG: sigma 54-interacting transcriptional regulator [Phycisphaerae bacterium]|nr:sigma 54-interacting transcriptional regulator [Phycisphaerae bacterium]